MKLNFSVSLLFVLFAWLSFTACKQGDNKASGESNETTSTTSTVGQSGVVDNESQKNVVQVAVGSKDHTTLVAGLKAAEYVDVLANAGPFTVFAPTNAAFDKLPTGTLDDLIKPEKKMDLRNILEYHVTTSSLKAESFTDGQIVGMVNGDNATIKIVNGKISVNGANIIASIPASNGMIHVTDAVLLPPTKK